MNEILIKEIYKIVESNNLIIYDIRFTKFDNNDIFEVVVDNKTNNVDMNNIEKITKPISNLLNDYESEMPENYYLQVISPGLKRNLKTNQHYELSLNKKIKIKYRENQKTFKIEGTLLNINPIKITTDEKIVEIKFENIKEGKWVE